VGISANTESSSANLTVHPAGAGASGFAPIEIPMAITLLGIVAAAFVPRTLTSSEAFFQRDLLQKVHLVRGQIEHFRQNHNNHLPGEGRNSAEEFLRDLSSASVRSDHSPDIANGNDVSIGESLPLNPYTQTSEVLVIPDRLKPHHYSGNSRHGWTYSSTTGEFRANISPMITDRSGRKIHHL